ncbi:hypothetical protein KNC47_003801 [Salmonella enterica]|nr:hypothetical protein [Salmonella enterica]
MQKVYAILFISMFSSECFSVIGVTKDEVIGHPPVITDVKFNNNSPRQGEEVTVSENVTDPDGDTILTKLYQWQSNGKDIPGADKASFTVDSSVPLGASLTVKIIAKTDSNITEPSSAELVSQEIEIHSLTTILVNGFSYADNIGFPTTGFQDASFQLQINGDISKNTNYKWVANQSWVSVSSSGVVDFISKPTASTKTVKITATSKNTGSEVLNYTFTINKWYTGEASNTDWNTAFNLCKSKGLTLIEPYDTTHTKFNVSSARMGLGIMGNVYSEWRQLYSTSLINGNDDYRAAWTSLAMTDHPNSHAYVYPGGTYAGIQQSTEDSRTKDVVCVEYL